MFKYIIILLFIPTVLICEESLINSGFEILLKGYWAQVGSKDFKDNGQKYTVTYGSERYYDGLYVENNEVEFLDGIYRSSLMYSIELSNDEIFLERARSNIKNTVSYKLKDSSLFIKRVDENYSVMLYIKLLNKDSLILFNPNLEYSETFERKNYENIKPVKINKIEYYHGPSLWSGPEFKAEIFEDGTLVYDGIRGVEKLGKYRGKLDKVILDDLMNKLIIADIPSLKSHYSNFMTDAASSTLTVTYNETEVKSIEDYNEGGPIELLWVYSHFHNFEKKVKLDKY